MDLNHLYSQHQLSLMRAAATTSRLARTRYLATAGTIGNRIRNHQLSAGAPASSSWLRSMEPSEQVAGSGLDFSS